MIQIRAPKPSDTAALLKIASSTGLFTAAEADALLGRTLEQFHASSLGDGHEIAMACSADGIPLGWIYYAPDAYAEAVLNVWWIGVSGESRGSGVAARLLRLAESAAMTTGARIIVVETSDDDLLRRARRFYLREGYSECGRIPHFYAENEAKVLFSKRVS